MSFWYRTGVGLFARGMMGRVFAVCCGVCLPVVAAPVTALDGGRSADNVCRAGPLKDGVVSREVAAIRKRAMDGDSL